MSASFFKKESGSQLELTLYIHNLQIIITYRKIIVIKSNRRYSFYNGTDQKNIPINVLYNI